VPLHRGGRPGSWVAGIRFRAWSPPSALHPSIGVQAPLTFDVVDTWNNRSLGGCTYHVSHPGGRAYEVFPLNSREAEARRAARFAGSGHTAGLLATTTVTPAGEYPVTLDLRRAPAGR
jgi:uncharacterized protein (DUF2126 family)